MENRSMLFDSEEQMQEAVERMSDDGWRMKQLTHKDDGCIEAMFVRSEDESIVDDSQESAL